MASNRPLGLSEVPAMASLGLHETCDEPIPAGSALAARRLHGLKWDAERFCAWL